MPIGTQKSLTLYAITVFALAVVLTAPLVAQAVGIGEIVLQSRLGEPLLAQVDLIVGSSERIDDSCLSLTAPDPHDDDTSGYLTKANLSLKIEGKRQYVVISSRQSLNDAFAKLRLQVKCQGMGSIIKTLTILPEIDAPVPQIQIAAPIIPTEVGKISVPPQSETHDVAAVENRLETQNSQPEIEMHIAKKAKQRVNKHTPTQRIAASKQNRSSSFILKLSGSPIDGSRIGKVSVEERTILLEQQKQLDADDQTARFLTMQHQLKQLQDELSAIKLQLAQLGASPFTVASSPVSSSTPLAAAGIQENHAKPEAENVATLAATLAQSASAVRPAKPDVPKVVAPPPSLLNEILGEPLYLLGGAAALLGLGGIGFMLVRRRFEDGHVGKDKEVVNRGSTRITAPIAPSPDTGDFTNIVTAAETDALPDSDNVDPISEADLFLTFGRDKQAEEVLKNFLDKNPDNQQIRVKLLSIYADRKDTQSFIAVAGEVRDSGDVAVWTQATEMGRILAPGNPMFGGEDNKETTELPQDEITIMQPPTSLDFDLDFGVKEVKSATLDLPLDFPIKEEHSPDNAEAPVPAPTAAKETDFLELSEINLNLDALVPSIAPEKGTIEPTKTKHC